MEVLVNQFHLKGWHWCGVPHPSPQQSYDNSDADKNNFHMMHIVCHITPPILDFIIPGN